MKDNTLRGDKSTQSLNFWKGALSICSRDLGKLVDRDWGESQLKCLKMTIRNNTETGRLSTWESQGNSTLDPSIMIWSWILSGEGTNNTGTGPTSVMRPKSRMQMRPSAVLSRLPGCGSACSRPVSSSCTRSKLLNKYYQTPHMGKFEGHHCDLQRILENADISSSSRRHLK